MITTFYPPYSFGGDGVFIYRLSNALARLGHHVDIIHCLDSYYFFTSEIPTNNFPQHPNIKVHGLKSKLGGISPVLTHQTGFPFLKGKKIKKILDNKNFDVVHFHNISLIGGPGILRYGKAIKLFTTHEHWLICPLSLLWKFKNKACVKKNCFLCVINAWRPIQLWRYSKMLERMSVNIDAFISPSKFTQKKHHEMGFKSPIIHIPHFLSQYTDEEIKPGRQVDVPVSSLQPYFLFAGRLVKTKGLHTLIKIFRHFNKSNLLISGQGNYGNQLREMAKGNKHIRFLGQKSYKELRNLYKNAIAVIVPSLSYEVFGNIIIEAFAMKTPVIVNNTGALPELVQQSGGGFIYNNETGLLKAMELLASNPSLKKDLGGKGYIAYKKNWTEEKYFEKYFNLIYSVAKKKSSNT